MGPKIKISIIMPVRNEAKSLPGVLRQLQEQEINPAEVEIIIADGCSEDATVAVAEQAAKSSRLDIRVVPNNAIRSSAGRNAGFRVARGEVIVFLDGHCYLPSKKLLADTLRLIELTGADCLCRPQPLFAPSAAVPGRVIAAARASWLGHGLDSLIYNIELSGFVDPASSGATYRRSALEAIGPYDEQFDACEDVELNVRLRKAGMRAYTHPSLAVYYEPRGTLRGLFAQMLRYGRGRVRLAARHPDTLSPGVIAPAILVPAAAAAAASIFLPGAIKLLLAAPFVLYLIIVVLASIQLTAKNGLSYLFLGPLAYLATHFGLGCGLFAEFFSFRWLKWRLHPRRTADLANT